MLSRNHTVKAVAAIVEARDPPSANSVQAVQKQFNVFVYFNYKKRIVILHATPSTVTVELENSIAGNVAKILGFTNVAAGTAAIQGKPEKAPYSIEVLVEMNPDIIFITSMGTQEKVEKRLHADVEGNPAYAALNAVKNNKVYVLPEDLFLLAPGLRYPEAVELMAKDVFPESFK